MYSALASLLVAACVFAGGIAGLLLHRLLPAHHQTKETHEIVRLGTGMLSVLASLVLGLLIGTAKTSSDKSDGDIRTFAADLILLSETLRDYGDPPAKTPSALLYAFTDQTIHDIWPDRGQPAIEEPLAGRLLECTRETIRALPPGDAGRTWLQAQALDLATSLLMQRWQLIEHQGPNVRPLVLLILVSWITVIFLSFGLNAPRNGTVVSAFLVCALAIGGATFLILEMDSPFQGVLEIASGPMTNALAYMPGASLEEKPDWNALLTSAGCARR